MCLRTLLFRYFVMFKFVFSSNMLYILEHFRHLYVFNLSSTLNLYRIYWAGSNTEKRGRNFSTFLSNDYIQSSSVLYIIYLFRLLLHVGMEFFWNIYIYRAVSDREIFQLFYLIITFLLRLLFHTRVEFFFFKKRSNFESDY